MSNHEAAGADLARNGGVGYRGRRPQAGGIEVHGGRHGRATSSKNRGNLKKTSTTKTSLLSTKLSKYLESGTRPRASSWARRGSNSLRSRDKNSKRAETPDPRARSDRGHVAHTAIARRWVLEGNTFWLGQSAYIHVNIEHPRWRRNRSHTRIFLHKKKYDELKAIVEAELIGSFEKTRSHGIGFKGFTPQGVLDEVDLSLLRMNVPSLRRRSTTWWPIHCIGTLRAW
ncbi:hypothetical protein QYE76_067440 [Lolium multiflorum]|uniref:Uncharacterized protein n=1 Tax=Lolium multiflorum TaxID=4521 RepID=A0AAD8SEV1_LOLMU|nr:hypothetical protein QYE76_067440 [Lolium multiflorum]